MSNHLWKKPWQEEEMLKHTVQSFAVAATISSDFVGDPIAPDFCLPNSPCLTHEEVPIQEQIPTQVFLRWTSRPSELFDWNRA
jgi:hypothetical protein